MKLTDYLHNMRHALPITIDSHTLDIVAREAITQLGNHVDAAGDIVNPAPAPPFAPPMNRVRHQRRRFGR